MIKAPEEVSDSTASFLSAACTSHRKAHTMRYCLFVPGSAMPYCLLRLAHTFDFERVCFRIPPRIDQLRFIRIVSGRHAAKSCVILSNFIHSPQQILSRSV